MKSEMKRWIDEENFFWVQTCIKPNLVLSEISEMKRWRDEEKFFWSEHVSSQIWCYLKLVRWRVRWRDEENVFFWGQTCIKPNLVLSEVSEMKRWRVRWTDEQIVTGCCVSLRDFEELGMQTCIPWFSAVGAHCSSTRLAPQVMCTHPSYCYHA